MNTEYETPPVFAALHLYFYCLAQDTCKLGWILNKLRRDVCINRQGTSLEKAGWFPLQEHMIKNHGLSFDRSHRIGQHPILQARQNGWI
jgi:hypothetical protein